jgi:hypothetical protein
MRTSPRRQRPQPTGRDQGGAALLVVLVLLASMAVLVVTNTRVLASLDRDLKLIEQKQLRRLQAGPPAARLTNAPPAANR